MGDNYLEQISDGRSPGVVQGTDRVMRTSRLWYWEGPFQANQLQNIFQTILGSTYYNVNQNASGSLNRILPLSDPLYPWCYANAVTGFRGVGGGIDQEPAELTTNTSTFSFWTLYPNYEFTVECSSRPYAVSPDTTIQNAASTVNWYDVNNTKQSTKFYPEWLRFCDRGFAPMDQYATQQRGGAYFQTNTGNEPGANKQATFQQSALMYLPDQVFRILWHGVPARYILSSNSYLNKFRGKVNQVDWNGPFSSVLTNPRSPSNTNGNIGFFPMGSLLYQGYHPTFYSPVLPLNTNVFGTFISYDLLVDLELIFLHTIRVAYDLPDLSATNKNYVAAGWNTHPYLPQRQFYYAYFKDQAGNQRPAYSSFPVELLFTDPDADNAYTGTG
jgi:hypothetical protein